MKTSKQNVGATEIAVGWNYERKILGELIASCDELIQVKKALFLTCFNNVTEAIDLRQACLNKNYPEILLILKSVKNVDEVAGYIEGVKILIDAPKRKRKFNPLVDQEEEGWSTVKTENRMKISQDERISVYDGTFQWVDPALLKPHPVISELHKMDPRVLKSMEKYMEEYGYDARFPIQVAFGRDGLARIWDGLTRHRAALNIKRDRVYIQITLFASDESLIFASARTHMARRNSDEAAVLRYVEKLLDKRSTLQECYKEQSIYFKIASVLGCSEATVKNAQTLMGHAGYRQKVLDGELAVDAAYAALIAEEKDKLEGKAVRRDRLSRS